MWKEFKEFAVKGNVIDLAVGVIIGAAFGQIVASLVGDIIMPPLGMVIGGIDFSEFYINLKPGTHFANITEAKAASAPVIAYGLFLNQVIRFIIVAFAVFLIVKQVNRFKKNSPVASLSKSEELLTEIRDELKKKK